MTDLSDKSLISDETMARVNKDLADQRAQIESLSTERDKLAQQLRDRESELRAAEQRGLDREARIAHLCQSEQALQQAKQQVADLAQAAAVNKDAAEAAQLEVVRLTRLLKESTDREVVLQARASSLAIDLADQRKADELAFGEVQAERNKLAGDLAAAKATIAKTSDLAAKIAAVAK